MTGHSSRYARPYYSYNPVPCDDLSVRKYGSPNSFRANSLMEVVATMFIGIAASHGMCIRRGYGTSLIRFARHPVHAHVGAVEPRRTTWRLSRARFRRRIHRQSDNYLVVGGEKHPCVNNWSFASGFLTTCILLLLSCPCRSRQVWRR